MTSHELPDAAHGAGLNGYARRVTSQWGEDGILAEVFRRVGVRHAYCVEFGAWDGRHLSNVYTLWHDEGWSALLIEGEEERLRALRDDVASFDSVTALHRWVATHGDDRLDAILDEAGAPTDPDLVSIDIDGDDYHVFESLETHRPRCVVVEHNPTIPAHLEVVQQPGMFFGCSARALLGLAHRKGYRLCACTTTNSIFVREEDFAALAIEEPKLEDVFPTEQLTYLVTGYNGAALVNRVPVYRNRLKRGRLVNLGPSGKTPPALTGPDALIPVEIHLPRDRGCPREIRAEGEKGGEPPRGPESGTGPA